MSTNGVDKRLRDDALAIWRAGVQAVDSQPLVSGCLRAKEQSLEICGQEFSVGESGRIVVVGAGKAGAGMAAGVEAALEGSPLAARTSGWVNVPADCVRPLKRIHLHAARGPGQNEPTAAGVAGAEEILRRVRQLRTDDLCLVLLSGGASALLPAPVRGISLADKLAVTRLLMAGGATINELNCVRKQLSAIKGGNLARTAGSTRVVTLIISDVVGDPLDVIGSGPTVADRSTVADALAILERVAPRRTDVPASVWSLLEAKRNAPPAPLTSNIWNFVIGNNQTALSAAASEAARLGYAPRSQGSHNEGEAQAVGRELGRLLQSLRDSHPSAKEAVCVLGGGETTVRLTPTNEPRRGGRNQELVLGAIGALWDDDFHHMALLSGGTDGEDGPTDAAGAVADADVIRRAHELGFNPQPFLAINNAYEFFERTGGLIKTGPTHTNVMDVWVGLIARSEGSSGS